MSARLRNGGCLTLFPAFPSPSPFPSDTLPNTDWAVCVASCYCRRSSEQNLFRLAKLCVRSHWLVHLQRVRPSEAEELQKDEEKEEGEVWQSHKSQFKLRSGFFHEGVLNNESYIWLRFTEAFPDITELTSHGDAGVRRTVAEMWI